MICSALPTEEWTADPLKDGAAFAASRKADRPDAFWSSRTMPRVSSVVTSSRSGVRRAACEHGVCMQDGGLVCGDYIDTRLCHTA